MTTRTAKQQQPIRSTIPARLDRLRWSPFHTRLVLGLGTAWVLDGLEITIASSVTGKLTQGNTLALSTFHSAEACAAQLQFFDRYVRGLDVPRWSRRGCAAWRSPPPSDPLRSPAGPAPGDRWGALFTPEGRQR